MSNLFPASYSKLSLYETCPDQLKYRYIDRLPQGPKGPQAERGTSLHASAEGYLKGEKTTLHRELAPIKAAIIETKKNKALVEQKLAFTRGLAKLVEWDNPTAWFRMVLDAVYKKGKTAHVQEWKSGRIYDDHVQQRQLYAIGAFHLYPDITHAKATTFYIDQKMPVEVAIDRDRANLLTWHFVERLEVMEKDKKFGARPGFYCRWCPYSRDKAGPCRVG